MYREFSNRLRIELRLTPQTLADLAKINKSLFVKAKMAYDHGVETYILEDEEAAYYILAKNKVKP